MKEDDVRIDYTVQVWKEGRQYVAHAMSLDVMSSGETPGAARCALDEAVALFLRTAADMGTLEQVLDDAGYTSGPTGWEAPVWVGIERHTLSVVAS